jgi:hypothetical protein
MQWDAVPKKIGIVKYDRKRRRGEWSEKHGYAIANLDKDWKKNGRHSVLAWDDGVLYFTSYDKEYPNDCTVVFPTIARAKKYLDATYASSEGGLFPVEWALPHDFTKCHIGYNDLPTRDNR